MDYEDAVLGIVREQAHCLYHLALTHPDCLLCLRTCHAATCRIVGREAGLRRSEVRAIARWSDGLSDQRRRERLLARLVREYPAQKATRIAYLPREQRYEIGV